LARAMADLGLAVDAGLADDTDDAALATAIARTRALAPTLTERGPATVDGLGLQRIAGLIAGPHCAEDA